jgi:hypothetical protein
MGAYAAQLAGQCDARQSFLIAPFLIEARLNLGQRNNRRCAIARYMDKLTFTNSVQG